MRSFIYTIKDEQGIHARPAGLIVKEAKTFRSEIILKRGNDMADLKKLFAVMGLAVKKGEEVTVTINGDDEDEAANNLESFIRINF